MFYIDVLKKALQLDLWDLHYLYSKPKTLERLLLADSSGLPRRGLLLRIGVYFGHLLSCLNPRHWLSQSRVPAGVIVLFAKTNNQRESLKPIQSGLPGAYLVGSHGDYSLDWTFLLAHLFSLPFFPYTWVLFFRSTGIVRRAFHYIFDQYWLIPGFYIAVRWWFHRRKPRALVLSNDHIWECRVMILAARDEGVPTVYLQHASITDEFPPLSMDVALLHGQDALSVYEKAGPAQTQVFLLGMPRFDAFAGYRNPRSGVGGVGVCCNLFDPMERVAQLCQTIRAAEPKCRLVLRPHPQDRRKSDWLEIAQQCQAEFSDSSQENAFDFLQKVDVLFSGNSNIHLEAALMDVYPIYFDYACDARLEKYSFLESGLCEYLSDLDAVPGRLKELAAHRPPVRHRARRYCATADTEYEGRSAELACHLIEELARQGQINLDDWQRVSGSALEAYELPGQTAEEQA